MSKGKVSGILGRAGVKKEPREVVAKPVVSKEVAAARRASAVAKEMRAAEIAQQRAVAEARESAYRAARPPRAVSSAGGHTCLYPMWRHGERPGPNPRYAGSGAGGGVLPAPPLNMLGKASVHACAGMSLTLTATPIIVATERRMASGARGWDWTLSDDERAVLTTMVRDGSAGTLQRREPGGAMVLLAWDSAAFLATVEARAEAAANVRRQQRGQPIIVRKAAARAVAMRTHAPFAGEPARWLE